jgi:flotillin
MLRKVGPNQALIRYGFGGTRIFQGEGGLVFPMIHNARELSLELMSFDVAPQQDMYTTQGVAVNVEAVAQIKVKSDPESILTAAEQFLSKPPDAREGLIRLVMEGHLRGIVGQLTVEQIVKQPEMVADKLRANTADDLSKMGLEIISFTIREVRDRNQYIETMGKPDVARIRREADIAAAEAERDTAIRRAETLREAAVAKALADQERVIAETASAARQAEAQRDLELKRAEYTQATQTRKAQADKAYDIQANITQQQVVAAQVQVEQVQKAEQIKVQEAEILRREKELVATVLRPAEIERQRIQMLAEAERQRIALEAAGRAEAARQQGLAQAEVTKATGEAEAEVIRTKGEAEAGAMHQKAESYRGYTQAAILDRMLAALPEIARVIAEPLAKVDKITVVSTDGQGGTGANRVTADIAKIAAQAPALLEALTGLKMEELLGRLVPPPETTPTTDNGAAHPIAQRKDGDGS